MRWWPKIVNATGEMVYDFINSFYANKKGLSARKLSAFVAMVVSIRITEKLVDASNLSDILMLWLGFVLICLGIITLQQIIEFKTNKQNESNKDQGTQGKGQGDLEGGL